jgi:hypothetical protein
MIWSSTIIRASVEFASKYYWIEVWRCDQCKGAVAMTKRSTEFSHDHSRLGLAEWLAYGGAVTIRPSHKGRGL